MPSTPALHFMLFWLLIKVPALCWSFRSCATQIPNCTLRFSVCWLPIYVLRFVPRKCSARILALLPALHTDSTDHAQAGSFQRKQRNRLSCLCACGVQTVVYNGGGRRRRRKRNTPHQDYKQVLGFLIITCGMVGLVWLFLLPCLSECNINRFRNSTFLVLDSFLHRPEPSFFHWPQGVGG